MRTANRVLKNTGFLYVKMCITMFISLYTTRLILASLGASDFGIFNIVGGTIALLTFLNNSLASSTQRFMNYTEGEGDVEKQKSIFNIGVILHLALAILIVIILVVVGNFLFNGFLNIPSDRIFASKVIYYCLIISTAFTITTVPYDAAMNAHENMLYYSIVGIFESILKLGIAIIITYTTSDKLILYGILMAIIPLITMMIMRIYCHRKYVECEFNPKKYWNKKLSLEMASFAGWGVLSSFSSIATMQGMSLLLNIFWGVIANTAHGVANQLSGQVMTFSNGMLKALNPVMVKDYGRGDKEAMIEAASTGNKLSFFIFSLFAIPFVVETPYILSLLLKNVPEYAVLFCRLVFIRQMITQLFVTLDTCIGATGRVKSMTILSCIIWGFPIIVGYICYKLGSPIYTIYLLLIITAFMRCANSLYFSHRQFGLDVFAYIKETILSSIFVALILLSIEILILYSTESSIYRLMLVVLPSLILYPFLTYYLSFNKKEKLFIISTYNTLKSKILSR